MTCSPRARRLAAGTALAATAIVPATATAARTPSNHDCFWLGPISTNVRAAGPEHFDGRNFNFPEESATYWLARYRLQAGQKLVLRGRYPHARYESLNSYAAGVPQASLPDTAIRSDPGSTNPFVAGARRNRSKRSWTVTVLDQAPPASGAAQNTLSAPSSDTASSEIVLRVYEPDRGQDLTGGVGLPKPEIVNADGSVERRLSSVCSAVNDPDRGLARTVQSISPATWQALVNTPGPKANPATSPAFDPPQWERFFQQGFSGGVFTQAAGNPRPLTNMVDAGGFYSNRDTRYILTHLSRKLGKVVVLRGRMPRFPETYDGAKRMPAAQLRFWSLCSAESRVTTRTPDCLADRQVPLGRKRQFTIVVSRKSDRPRNARARCGIAWLDWGNRGDVAGRPDYGLLLLRNMLPSPTFKQAILNITRFGDERKVMGKYFPRTAYSSTKDVEELGC